MISFNTPDEQPRPPKPGLTIEKLMKVKKAFEDADKEQAKIYAACEHRWEPHPFQSWCKYCLNVDGPSRNRIVLDVRP